MPWDSEKAVKWVQDHKLPPYGEGKCARYTADAVDAGGVKLVRTLSAKNFGPALIQAGFTEYTAGTATDFPQKGDVAVIAGFEADEKAGYKAHPHGHMQMYDGSAWVSDFQQNEFYPGKDYRLAKPAYKVYRYVPPPPVK